MRRRLKEEMYYYNYLIKDYLICNKNKLIYIILLITSVLFRNAIGSNSNISGLIVSFITFICVLIECFFVSKIDDKRNVIGMLIMILWHLSIVIPALEGFIKLIFG